MNQTAGSLEAPPNIGEPYVAAVSDQNGTIIRVRTLTDFEAVSEVGTKHPDAAWRVAGYYSPASESDLDLTILSTKSASRTTTTGGPRWKRGFEDVVLVDIPGLGDASNLPAAKKKGAYVPDVSPAEQYDLVCWQALLAPNINRRQAAVAVAAWGQSHGEQWWADVAEKYFSMAERDMKTAGLTPAVQ